MWRRAANLIAVLAVLAAYPFFATTGTFKVKLISWEESYYASLAEGFLHGRLSMMNEPSPELLELDNPYDPEELKEVFYLWDVSLYKGRYYLYFSAVPVVLFYIPFKLIAGAYPPDGLVATFFAACAFLLWVAFLRRALRDPKPRVPLWLWILLIGAGNILFYVLVNIRVYEVAVMTGMAFTAGWAYALLRYMGQPSRHAAAWIGVCVALAVASRPNTAVLLAITLLVVIRNRRVWLAVAIPIVVVLLLLFSYNAARFGSPFELGTTYQLTSEDMHGKHVCCLCRPAEVMRMVNGTMEYLFSPPIVSSRFPFLRLEYSTLDPRTSWIGTPELVVGIAPVIPLTMIGSLFALLVRPAPDDAHGRAGRWVIAGAWLVLFGLATCWWIVARYALDFMGLMTIGSIVCVERGLAAFEKAGFATRALRAITIILALWSIATGVLLGFSDAYDTMRHAHPQWYRNVLR